MQFYFNENLCLIIILMHIFCLYNIQLVSSKKISITNINIIKYSPFLKDFN